MREIDTYGEAPEDAGPLFAKPGPFDDSAAERDKITQLVGEIIWRHQGRANPIAIGTLCDKVGRFDRDIKGIVEKLVMTHNLLIGASREPGREGYFVVVDAEDFKTACGAYEKQIETMQKRMARLRGLASARGIVR